MDALERYQVGQRFESDPDAPWGSSVIEAVTYPGADSFGSVVEVVTVEPGWAISDRTHADRDEFLRLRSGSGGWVATSEMSYRLDEDTAVIVRAGEHHRIINRGAEPLVVEVLMANICRPSDTQHHDGPKEVTAL